MATRRLLTARHVARILAVRRAVLLGWVDAGEFPPPVMLPGGAERWPSVVVDGWVASLDRCGQRVSTVRPTAANRPGGLQGELLQALEENNGEWMQGQELASAVDAGLDHHGGSFRRAIRALKQAGLIETNQNLGYRTAAAKSGQ